MEVWIARQPWPWVKGSPGFRREAGWHPGIILVSRVALKQTFCLIQARESRMRIVDFHWGHCSILLMRHVTFSIVAAALVCSMVFGIWALMHPPVPFVNKEKELSGAAFTAALKEVNAQIAASKPKSPEESERLLMLRLKRDFLKEYCYLPDAETLNVFAYPSLWERASRGWSQDSCFKAYAKECFGR